MHGIWFAVVAVFAAAVAAASTIATDGGPPVDDAEEEHDGVGLPAAVTDIAAAEVGGAAAIDIGIGIRIDVSEDALLLLVIVFVSSVPYSPIGRVSAPRSAWVYFFFRGGPGFSGALGTFPDVFFFYWRIDSTTLSPFVRLWEALEQTNLGFGYSVVFGEACSTSLNPWHVTTGGTGFQTEATSLLQMCSIIQTSSSDDIFLLHKNDGISFKKSLFTTPRYTHG